MKSAIILFLLLCGCAGTYYVTEQEHHSHHPNCNLCTPYPYYNPYYYHTNTIIVKPYNKPHRPNRPNRPNRPHKPIKKYKK